MPSIVTPGKMRSVLTSATASLKFAIRSASYRMMLPLTNASVGSPASSMPSICGAASSSSPAVPVSEISMTSSHRKVLLRFLRPLRGLRVVFRFGADGRLPVGVPRVLGGALRRASSSISRCERPFGWRMAGWRGFVSGANFSVRRVCWLRRGRCVPPEMLLMSFLQNGFQPLHSGCCGGLVCDLYYFQMRMRQDALRIFRSG